MSTFDAAKFIAKIEGLGAELRCTEMLDGSVHVFWSIKSSGNWDVIDRLWKEQVASSPDRRKAVADILIKRGC